MKKFLVKRIGYMIVTLVIIITATFYMMHSIPGDPLAHMARNLPEQTKANYYAKYGLDKSTTEQYGIFMKNLITKGDLGESLKYPGTYITDTLLENSKVSATPGGLALIVGVFLGIILGIVAALHKNKWPPCGTPRPSVGNQPHLPGGRREHGNRREQECLSGARREACDDYKADPCGRGELCQDD